MFGMFSCFMYKSSSSFNELMASTPKLASEHNKQVWPMGHPPGFWTSHFCKKKKKITLCAVQTSARNQLISSTISQSLSCMIHDNPRWTVMAPWAWEMTWYPKNNHQWTAKWGITKMCQKSRESLLQGCFLWCLLYFLPALPAHTTSRSLVHVCRWEGTRAATRNSRTQGL